ncbi:hypothetical protein FUAX_30640 [Fulvitalea axinellae]|uniref:DUF3347 domain-containing protein n=1 Tax=Fulvitalea axinellae TaxID=1182444 RepID=A0AAU9CRM0_9BACT|nr:hypothetical protein FUAX_30640 [Fulvitalea axinellae]
MKHYPITFALALSVMACSASKKENGEEKNAHEQTETSEKAEEKRSLPALKKRILEIHDEVMPRMGELNALKTKLKTKIDSLNTLGDSTSNVALRLRAGVVEIDSADAAMWKWMHGFDGGFKGKTPEDTYAYYLKEEVSVDSMKMKILRAISVGTELSEGK